MCYLQVLLKCLFQELKLMLLHTVFRISLKQNNWHLNCKINSVWIFKPPVLKEQVRIVAHFNVVLANAVSFHELRNRKLIVIVLPWQIGDRGWDETGEGRRRPRLELWYESPAQLELLADWVDGPYNCHIKQNNKQLFYTYN